MRILTALNTKTWRRGLHLHDPEYTPAHVHALQRQLAKYAPDAAFECLTDIDVPGVKCIPYKHDWPGWWVKLALFDPTLLGDFLFLDLDTIVYRSLREVLEVRKLTVLRDFYRDGKKLKEGLGGGLMYLPESARREVWDYWIENPLLRMREYPRGDQFLLEKFWLNKAARWQDVVPGQVVSWKVHCKNGIVPEDARVICFHGQPRPWQVGNFLHLYR